MDKFIELEKNMTLCANLLEIIIGYCENNFDKSKELSALSDILLIIAEKQKEGMDILESVITLEN